MYRLTMIGLTMLLLASCAHEAPKYPPDSQSMDLPKDPAAIVEIPRFPVQGRSFAIERSTGAGDLLKVVDQNGTLEMFQGSFPVTSITLGPCLSFSRMNDQHDFGRQGKPEYATAPPDCRVWDGRRWNENYKTQTSYYHNPCLYESDFVARIIPGKDGSKIVETTGNGQGVVLDSGNEFEFNHKVVYDDKLQFFRSFSVGYVGVVRVLNEVK